MNNLSSFFSNFNRGRVIVIATVLTIVIGIPLTLLGIKTQQQIQNNAWYTTQSASASCTFSGTAIINFSFTNTETSSSGDMNVSVQDTQTGKIASLGTVKAQQTKTGSIDTGLSSIKAGNVIFTLTWASGKSGTDSRTAAYVATTCQPSSTPTPSVSTPTPTPHASTTPTITIAQTSTPTVTTAVTDTPTVTSTPSDTPVPSDTPTPGGSTDTPTPEITTVVTTVVTNVTNVVNQTATPTVGAVGPGNTYINLGVMGIGVVLLGALIFLAL